MEAGEFIKRCAKYMCQIEELIKRDEETKSQSVANDKGTQVNCYQSPAF